MISIIVYGRNDNRGYGMEKRVSLSLNNMAHLLSGATSEILFVDYNTPDHLPTLPELIADTLTEVAKSRLRVLRVRQASHARFADVTHLPVLEPVARNVALRRSRASNRWILSTNTDSLLILREGNSLEDIVGPLGKASYGVPRFELPERAWEGFDRRDPARVIAEARELGRVGRLDETVFGEGVVLFDGPGDFQLVPRSTLFAIDGFDEDMLLGWHIDHNLAARLEKVLGPTRSLSEHCTLYHCGHVRQPTQSHAHARLENDVTRFVTRVSTPDCPRQRDAWGCPDATIEEISLKPARQFRLLDVVSDVLPPSDEKLPAAYYDQASFDNFHYDAGHLATHALDLLSSLPQGAAIGFAGVRRDLFRLLRLGLRRCGVAPRFLVPDALAERLDCGDASDIHCVDEATFVGQAEFLVFEFGLIRDEEGVPRDTRSGVAPEPEENAALERIRSMFEAAMAAEELRLATGMPARLFVTLNAVHNRYEISIASQIAASVAPFSTRLRYGYLAAAAGGQTGSDSLAQALGAIMGSSEPPDRVAILRARGLLRDIVSGDADDGSLDLEIAAASDLILGLLALKRGGELPEVLDVKVRRRVEEASSAKIDGPFTEEEPCTPPGFASLAAWQAPDWRDGLDRLGGAPLEKLKRNGWLWERGQLLWALARYRRWRDGRALIVCEHPERLVGALGDLFGRIDIIDIRSLDGMSAPGLRSLSDVVIGPTRGGASFHFLEVPETAIYDAVVVPHSAAFYRGCRGLADVIERLRPCLIDGGICAIAGEMGVVGRDRLGRPDREMVLPKGIPALLQRHAALAPLQPQPQAITRRDAAFCGTRSDLDGGRPVLGVVADGDVLWPFVWLFEAVPGTIDGRALSTALHDTLLGEQLAAMHLGAAARREEQRIVTEPGIVGHVVFGPFLRLDPGHYRAVLDVEGAVAGGAPRLVAEVSVSDQIVIQSDLPPPAAFSFHHRFALPFAVGIPAEQDAVDTGQAGVCEIRLWSDGLAALTIRSIRLERETIDDAARSPAP